MEINNQQFKIDCQTVNSVNQLKIMSAFENQKQKLSYQQNSYENTGNQDQYSAQVTMQRTNTYTGIANSSSGQLQKPTSQIKAVGINSNSSIQLSHADVQDLNQSIQMMQSQQQKEQGLDLLGSIITKTGYSLMYPPCSSLTTMSNIFKGFRSCLQIHESQIDILMKVNQILYDLMPELNKLPNEMQNEITGLIPLFIENLGNPKPLVRKSTHKCIGTYVKFSKKLELVLSMIVKNGLGNQNQRTRQHSMLVIPALISLKPSVINDITQEMNILMDEITQRLRDPAENVAKTAKKLILELHKCYPGTFDKNYIETKTNEEEKQISNLIMQNNFDEAQKIIMATSPSKRMQIQQQTAAPISLQTLNQAQKNNLIPQQNVQYGAISKPFQQEISQKPLQVQVITQISKTVESIQSPITSQKNLQNGQAQHVIIGQTRDLSVIGREIMASQPQNKLKSNSQYEQQEVSQQPKTKFNDPYKPNINVNEQKGDNDGAQWNQSQL